MGLWDKVENIFPERGKQEQQDAVEDIIVAENIRPKSVLAYIDEIPWPIFFSERLPFSQVYGFTIEGCGNPDDFIAQYPTKPVPTELKMDNYEDLDLLLKTYRTDLFFASSALDYGNWLQGRNMAMTLADNEVDWILFIHDVLIKDSKLKLGNISGFTMFRQVLNERGYMIKEYTNHLDPIALQYYLAIAPKRIDQPILERTRRNRILTPSFA